MSHAPHSPLPVGHYAYDEVDRTFLKQRVAQFRDQVERRISGALTEEEFKPLRLMNGLYLQLHAYMLRVAIPYGILNSGQMRTLAQIAQRYDRDYGHFTTRQNIQFNWIRLEDTPDILALLADADMHAIQTSGNCIRNVTADQFAGAAADEVLDPRVHAEILRQWSTLHPEFTFLPRKFKIAISGSPQDRVAARFHDIGLMARNGENGRPVFEVYVGGGLGRTPIVGVKLRDDLPEEDLIAYLEAILRVYNEFGRRDNIYKARIKILVQALGVDEFRDRVNAEFVAMDRARYRLDEGIVAAIRARFGVPDFDPAGQAAEKLAQQRKADRAFDFWVRTNTHAHKQPGYVSVTISCKPAGGIPGDVTSSQMNLLADLADQLSFGELRITHLQNVVLGHVRQDKLYGLWQTLEQNGLGTANVGFITDIVACPGLDYCALANARSIPIAQKLSERFASPDLQREIGPLRLNISGCINACGHHHAGHIGILGVDKRGEEAFQITLGGAADQDTVSIGQIIGAAMSEDETVDAIARIIDTYLARRTAGEQFIETCRRLGTAPFKDAAYATA
ncbi:MULTISPECIES: nitrite/sulfite reductase [Acetobacter]|uniref:Nitrite/sulfite reductase n=1 Tax=Acetobacter tropicalis NBRC 101654 TaxID=749388 RepID=F7VC03_9PROT|nr:MULTISPECIES: nitrite/sulfite reductase [Acetobacter]MCG4253064.1 nitrite/sulfite reductase [Acetobacter senegalensis]MCG4258881.1 nitrite/sulfite reductase [Acetobacter senegalensis]MCG4268793.1 nitrite/sulfite reductase [Acetobacter senegalensis]MPQ74600.1 nitrite/sulfite reductase [Acetobacter senegalensis]GAA07898.1 nitrite/sulfite reductase [Acetobacter tropicalis NBRC 101654]